MTSLYRFPASWLAVSVAAGGSVSASHCSAHSFPLRNRSSQPNDSNGVASSGFCYDSPRGACAAGLAGPTALPHPRISPGGCEAQPGQSESFPGIGRSYRRREKPYLCVCVKKLPWKLEDKILKILKAIFFLKEEKGYMSIKELL